MPEFMVMILANETAEAQLAPSETKALVEGQSTYERELRDVFDHASLTARRYV